MQRPRTAIVVIGRMEMPSSTMAQFEANKTKFDHKKAYVRQEKEGEAFVGSPVMIRKTFVLMTI